jgi:hypothetical protein
MHMHLEGNFYSFVSAEIKKAVLYFVRGKERVQARIRKGVLG